MGYKKSGRGIETKPKPTNCINLKKHSPKMAELQFVFQNPIENKLKIQTKTLSANLRFDKSVRQLIYILIWLYAIVKVNYYQLRCIPNALTNQLIAFLHGCLQYIPRPDGLFLIIFKLRERTCYVRMKMQSYINKL